MSDKFPNGSMVHRWWGSLEEAELIAEFQYFEDAVAFLKALQFRAPDDKTLIVFTVVDKGCGRSFSRMFQQGILS